MPVLEDFDVGAVRLVHPTDRYLAARVRTILDLAVERLGESPPRVVAVPERARSRR